MKLRKRERKLSDFGRKVGRKKSLFDYIFIYQ